MTITLHWWVLPAFLTALWALFAFWPARLAMWDDIARFMLTCCALVPVLVAWILGLICRGFF